MIQRSFIAIGLMSGSSLDGLDIACVQFEFINTTWEYKILHCSCIPYPQFLYEQLIQARNISSIELYRLHSRLGTYFGQCVTDFIKKNQITNIDLIASHGHTIFHEPHNNVSVQIGCGAAIAASSGIKTVCDLRSSDIAYGGQGAPIVPIGDRLLFNTFDAWINIGGICNITLKKDANTFIAYDIGVANQILNYYSKQVGKEYDENGTIAASSTINKELLEALNQIDYYNQVPPKSLDNGFRHEIISLIDRYTISVQEKIATYTYHIALQIAAQCKNIKQVLVCGGGAHNTFLIQTIKAHTTATIVCPDATLIDFKEAIVMAFIGVLRICEIPNVYASVTGASNDSCNGAIYIP